MKEPLWQPSDEVIQNANMTKFIDFVNENYGKNFSNFQELYDWSVDDIPSFWAAMWDFGNIIASKKYDTVVEDLGKFPGTNWFPGAKLNFAENLLRHRDDQLAFIFRGEDQKKAQMTYQELSTKVAQLVKPLRELGIKPGDRVAAYMPNLIETVIAMLAGTAVGATWSACGTELGPKAVLDRLGQVEPKILFTVDGYFYKAKPFNVLANVEKIVKDLPSVEKVVVIPYASDNPDISNIPNAVMLEDFLDTDPGEIEFEQLPFDHPVYIMFSSGTTGKPKCMVQSTGGILINQLKELVLHTDLKREDRIFYITSPSWMMWNWLVTSLAVGATIVLFDGNVNYPSWETMWKMVEEEKITIFGCSASYINYLRSVDAKPGSLYDMSTLREISQTGSVLSAEGFEYIYREVKKDLHFNSISGGTDINGCFACGSPIQAVYAGELQGAGLAMKVKAYGESGTALVDKEGELVCEAPAPSMPIYFWNDPEDQRYRDAYFDVYAKVWCHGDWIMMHSDTGGITFFGRSDFTLNPSGVRIGPAEIYNIVEEFHEVADSMAVGQNWQGDQRILLFIKLAEGAALDDELMGKLKKAIRSGASPRHVPALILETPDIPYTFTMKKVESAVANILHGRPVTNRDALTNPESLEFYEKIKEELKE
jgi:acetoacetyl-CoA synthetase